MMSKVKCVYCWDRGQTKENPNYCKHCGTYREKGPTNQEVEDMDKVKDFYNILIPRQYLDIIFSKSTLFASNPELYDLKAYRVYGDVLQTVYDRIREGNLPNKSAFIYAPSRNGKQTFVYSCMKELVKKDIPVFPYLDVIELKKFLEVKGESKLFPFWKEEEVYTTPLLFIKVPYQFNKYNRFLLDLLDRRARYGNITYIISRYPVHRVFDKYMLENILPPKVEVYYNPKYLNVLNYQ